MIQMNWSTGDPFCRRLRLSLSLSCRHFLSLCRGVHLSRVVTLVDGVTFLSDYSSGEAVGERKDLLSKENATVDDPRGVALLLAEQARSPIREERGGG